MLEGMYRQLVVKHFECSVQEVLHLPVPSHLHSTVDTILFLRNPKYPRHFLNGFYVILSDNNRKEAQLAVDSVEKGSVSVFQSIFHLINCSEDRWRLLDIWKQPRFSKHLPVVCSCRLLASNSRFRNVITTERVIESSSCVLSLRPTFRRQVYASLQCYFTQVTSSSRIIDGTNYFCAHYPAKATLCDHEYTLAWVCAESDSPVGYIQYLCHENARGESEALITGLAVEDPYQRRGFGQALIESAICRLSNCKEIWISVSEQNEAALRLYLKCGFAKRERHWDTAITLFTLHSAKD